MQNSLRRTLRGVDKTIVDPVDLDVDTGILVASVRPTSSMRNLCGSCRKRRRRYDAGDDRRRWRPLDAGSVQMLTPTENRANSACRLKTGPLSVFSTMPYQQRAGGF